MANEQDTLTHIKALDMNGLQNPALKSKLEDAYDRAIQYVQKNPTAAGELIRRFNEAKTNESIEFYAMVNPDLKGGARDPDSNHGAYNRATKDVSAAYHAGLLTGLLEQDLTHAGGQKDYQALHAQGLKAVMQWVPPDELSDKFKAQHNVSYERLSPEQKLGALARAGAALPPEHAGAYYQQVATHAAASGYAMTETTYEQLQEQTPTRG